MYHMHNWGYGVVNYREIITFNMQGGIDIHGENISMNDEEKEERRKRRILLNTYIGISLPSRCFSFVVGTSSFSEEV